MNLKNARIWREWARKRQKAQEKLFLAVLLVAIGCFLKLNQASFVGKQEFREMVQKKSDMIRRTVADYKYVETIAGKGNL